jgi:integrase/recombinase XerD
LYPVLNLFVSLTNKGIQRHIMGYKNTSKSTRKPKEKPEHIFTYSPGKSLIVRLRGKLLANKCISLYLDYYQGYSITDGEMKTKRKIEYLKIYLIQNPKTPEERIKNDEYLSLAQSIRSNRESDIKHNSAGLIAPFKKKINFLDYCDSYEANYQKKDIRMINMAIREFKLFAKDTYITPALIDQKRVRDFRDYLINKFKGETPNSTFARFKKILNAATDEGLFTHSPGAKVTCKAPTGITKEILSIEEVVKLYNTDCRNQEIKRAFLFCLNTGLRFVDVNDLYFRHISNNQLRKQQQKTGREVTIDLNNNAIKLISEPGKPDEKIFNLPSLTGCLKTLKNWAGKAGINRNITWHSARHSFATILLINNTDIKTVGNLLGHSKLEHTQKYTHVVDALKKKAVNSLPDINLKT